MAITKREKRDLHILMHQLRVVTEVLTKGKEPNHSLRLQRIKRCCSALYTRCYQLELSNEKRKQKRKKRNER